MSSCCNYHNLLLSGWSQIIRPALIIVISHVDIQEADLWIAVQAVANKGLLENKMKKNYNK